MHPNIQASNPDTLLYARMNQVAQQTRYRGIDQLNTIEKLEVLEKVCQAAKQAIKTTQQAVLNAPSWQSSDTDHLFNLAAQGNIAALMAAQPAFQAKLQSVNTQPAEQESEILLAANRKFEELIKSLPSSESSKWTQRWMQILKA